MGNVHTTGPNEALVVSGGGLRSTDKKTVIGGWAWAWWCISDVQRISLNVMTLIPRCDSVETAEGVPVTVTAVAQVKVITEKSLLQIACEQFMGQSVEHICHILNETLEGHLRAILGTLTVESIYRDRDAFADNVRDVAAPDLGRMGMEILSFTIKDIDDKVDYLDSLGRTQTAIVKRNATIGVAEANRDAGIREAECEKNAMDTKFMVDAKVADQKRLFEMNKAAFDTEVNRAKAQAELAYELQGARERQHIRQEELEIDVVERRKQISIEEKEIARKEKDLFGTVRLPAEAEAFKVQTLAEGRRTQQIAKAEASAQRVRLVGDSEAAAIEAVGKADAERMRARAAAYRQYGDAAMVALVLEALPQIAAELSAPLAKTKEVVMIGGQDRMTGEVARLAGSLPPALQALTGIDLSKVISQAVK